MDKVKCWDCRKDIKVELDEETKKKCPKTPSGIYYIICDDCRGKGNNS